MAQVVFRVAKLKDWGNIAAAGSHNLRARPTPNADPKKKNVILVGPSSVEGIMDAFKKKLAGVKVRKNAVMGCEAVISASPEYFRPDDPARGGYWHQDKLDEWRAAIEPWIEEKFPHAVSVILHLDEDTPHYQVITVPIDDKGKLNYRGLYGGDRQTLRNWQTEAAKPVAHLGIERGKEGSKAEHVPLKKFYGSMNAPDPAPLPQPIKPPEPLPSPSLSERIPGTQASSERKALEQKHAEEKAAARKRLEERKRAALKAHPILTAKAKVGPLVDQKMNALDREAQAAKKAARLKDEQIKALKEEADRLRALPLSDVLEKLYGGELCDGSLPKHTTRKYLLTDGTKIGVSPGRNGGEVWVRQGDQKGAKSAIDLVMTLDGCDYKTALKILGDAFGSTPVAREHARNLVVQASKQVKAVLAEPTPPPAAEPTLWPKVRRWLNEVRALPERLIDWVHERGLVYADHRSNAVFARFGGGAFIRGITDKPFKRTLGGKADGPYHLPGSSDIVICESPTDALSIKSAYSEVEILATGGNLMRPDDVQKYVSKGKKIWLAFDNDEAGQKFTEEYQKTFPEASVLKLDKRVKDWNDGLQRGLVAVDDAWSANGSAGTDTEQKRHRERQKFF